LFSLSTENNLVTPLSKVGGAHIVESYSSAQTLLLFCIRYTQHWSNKGFLASNEEEYCDSMIKALSMTPVQRIEMQKAARNVVNRFSDDAFAQTFLQAIQSILK
jgi:hypothetical protein